MYLVQGEELGRYVPGTRGGVGAVCTWYMGRSWGGMYLVQGEELGRYVPGTRGGVEAVCTWYKGTS